MNNFIKITKALSDQNRVRTLAALYGGELCVCQIVKLLDLAPSTVSKHMSILRQTDLVKSRKAEKWIYYSLPNDDAPLLVKNSIAWVLNSVLKTKCAKEDAKKIKRILRIDPIELCKLQSQTSC